MTDYVLAPPPTVSAAIADETARFPVRRIFCVGRNYGAHVKEMGGDAKEQPPIFFTKPADAVISDGASVPYPSATRELHHEIELVVALRSGGRDLRPEAALACIYGYAAGVDLTRRDLQGLAKKAAQPWDAAKAFDASAPLGPIRRMEGEPPPAGARIRLEVDGQARQDARLSDMIWSVPEVIAEASRLWTLQAGDLIFTGTPEGVGPVERGQRVDGEVEGVGAVTFTVA
ncbi:MAG: fumarylacetoacetate hydrolase family protein [Caulobacteraceae bacterium]|nr:fumarylacetoacetate hydrolase family protein [Caulobacter sp.]